MPIPEPHDNVIGYSLFTDGKRLNEEILREYSAEPGIVVRPVIRGGYETVYGSRGSQSNPNSEKPLAFAFSLFPNPFVSETRIKVSSMPFRRRWKLTW